MSEGKVCGKCATEKPVTMFHRSNHHPGGRHPHCAQCYNAHKRRWRERNIDLARSRDREQNARRGNRGVRDPRGGEAHKAVRQAVLRGDLTKPDECPVCGRSDSPIYGHHEDYARPLDVQWVCARCHQRLHAA